MLSGVKGLAALQKLNRNVVGRAHKRHEAITGRTLDGDAMRLQTRTQCINIVDCISEVPKVPSTRISLRIPIESQFDLSAAVSWRSQKNQSEAPPWVVLSA